MVDQLREVNVEGASSRNASQLRKPLTSLQKEYPLSYEHRSNSLAITKFAQKRKAEKMQQESLINVASENIVK